MANCTQSVLYAFLILWTVLLVYWHITHSHTHTCKCRSKYAYKNHFMPRRIDVCMKHPRSNKNTDIRNNAGTVANIDFPETYQLANKYKFKRLSESNESRMRNKLVPIETMQNKNPQNKTPQNKHPPRDFRFDSDSAGNSTFGALTSTEFRTDGGWFTNYVKGFDQS